MVDNGLSQASVLKNLTTKFIGQTVLYYPSIPSTMDIAREVARKGAAEGTIVLADEQTAGKGRLQRTWLSPRSSSLALSIVLRPSLVELPCLTMVASLAATRSIAKVTGLKPGIKWPNDVLIGSKKVCGILVESELGGNIVEWAVLGIGMNVNLDPAAFPEIATIATSLSLELGRKVSRLEVLHCLLLEVELLYMALRTGEPIYKEWRRNLETLGKAVRVQWGEVVEEGYAESVDTDGSLLLRRSDGTLAKIVAGDVTLRS